MSMHQHDPQGNPSIHCSVGSCKHNHASNKMCTLHAINVCPTKNNSSAKADESMCDSYEH